MRALPGAHPVCPDKRRHGAVCVRYACLVVRRGVWAALGSAVALSTGCSLFVDTDGLEGAEAGGAGPDASTSALADAAAPDGPEAGSGPREIVFRGVQVAGPVDGETIELARPAVQPGDFMLVALYQYNPKAVVGGLDGWQVRVSLDPSGSDGVHGTHSLRVLSRIATGAEPPSYTITLTEPQASDFASGILAAWSGTDLATPIDVEKAVTKAYKPGAVPSVTTNFANDVLVAVTSTSYGRGASWTAPTGMSERAATGVLGLFTAPPQATPGATGERPYATSATYDTGLGAVAIALRPR